MSYLIYILYLVFGFYVIRLPTCTVFVTERTVFNLKVEFLFAKYYVEVFQNHLR